MEAGRMAANHLGTLKRDERELVEEQQTAWSQPQLPAAAPPLQESLPRWGGNGKRSHVCSTQAVLQWCRLGD